MGVDCKYEERCCDRSLQILWQLVGPQAVLGFSLRQELAISQNGRGQCIASPKLAWDSAFDDSHWQVCWTGLPCLQVGDADDPTDSRRLFITRHWPASAVVSEKRFRAWVGMPIPREHRQRGYHLGQGTCQPPTRRVEHRAKLHGADKKCRPAADGDPLLEPRGSRCRLWHTSGAQKAATPYLQ